MRRAPSRSRKPNLNKAPRSPHRMGKKMVSGHFSLEMSLALNVLAVEQGTSLQALMGEAFDDLMREYGKHPFGER